MKRISDLKIPKTAVKGVEMKKLFFGVTEKTRSAGGSENISDGHYPSVYPRKRRARLGEYGRIDAVFPEGQTARIEDGTLYVGKSAVQGEYFSEYFKHSLLKLGGCLTVMPDGFYYNTEDPSDRGAVSRSVYVGASGIGVTTVDGDLNAITEYTVSATKPSGAVDGHLWAKPKVSGGYEMMIYDAHEWYPYESYVKLTVPSLVGRFRVGDVLECTGADRTLGKYVTVSAAAEDGIYVKGAAPHVEKITEVWIKRPMPHLQYFTVVGGRMVGVGCTVDAHGKTVARAYASAFNDPLCWSEYGGAMSVELNGSGEFTAITEYCGDVLAFREDSVTRIKISESKMTFSELKCEGVPLNGEKSVVGINGTVYFRGRDGIWAYDGGMPERISNAISHLIDFSHNEETGGEVLSGDIFPGEEEEYPLPFNISPAGGYNGRYYVLLKGRDGRKRICVYSPENGVWCIEDDPGVTEFFSSDGVLLAVVSRENGSAVMLWDADGITSGITESFTSDGKVHVENSVSWTAESDTVYADVKNGLRPSRIFVKMSLESGALVKIGCICNGEALPRRWTSVSGHRDGYFEVPVPIGNCESVSLRIAGRGEAEISGCEIEYRQEI